MSQEFDTIIVNSPVFCNEAESHETLEESKWQKNRQFLQNSATAQTQWDYIKTISMRDVRRNVELQLILAYTRNAQNIKIKKKNKKQPKQHKNTTQHSTALQP